MSTTSSENQKEVGSILEIIEAQTSDKEFLLILRVLFRVISSNPELKQKFFNAL